MKIDRIRYHMAQFVAAESAVTAIEYALIASLIFGVIVSSVALLGDAVLHLFNGIATKVSAAIS